MPLIRPRILPGAGAPFLRTVRSAYTANVRYLSSSPLRQAEEPPKTSPEDAPSTPSRGSSMTRKESPSEAMARHQPDYNATVDHGTS